MDGIRVRRTSRFRVSNFGNSAWWPDAFFSDRSSKNAMAGGDEVVSKELCTNGRLICNGSVASSHGRIGAHERASTLIRNERCERWVVKAVKVMDRVKVALVSLLPVLWLMAAGQSFADPCRSCATASASDSKFGLESGRHCPSNKESSSIDLSARRGSARIGSQSAKASFFPVEPTTGSQVNGRRFLANFSSVREGPRALATRWQFDYRAASEPRAPSSVS